MSSKYVKVPSRVLSSIVQEYLDEQDMGESISVRSRFGPNVHGRPFSATQALSENAGMKRTTINRILEGKGEVTFETADNLLTTMEMSYLWWEKPLLDYYAVPLPPKAEDGQRCRNGHLRTPENTRRYGRDKSVRCIDCRKARSWGRKAVL